MAYRYRRPANFDLSNEQKLNLRKLADKLATVPDNQFDMNNYFANKSGRQAYCDPVSVTPEDYQPECGTIACACGWGPAAGVPAQRDENWNGYAARAFGADVSTKRGKSLYSYLFDEEQGGTAKMAARRIETVLRNAA